MWNPTDLNAFPTPKELMNAKEAIRDTERRLAEAVWWLERTKRLVTLLQVELDERRAWISPERKLNFDILSLVFELCGEQDSRSVLSIACVSRKWRAIVLATPRAWSNLCFDGNMDFGAVEAFFERSASRPFHAYCPYTSMAELEPVADRLHCASFASITHRECTLAFPVLQSLAVRHTSRLYLRDINTVRFPSLRHLVYDAEFMLEQWEMGVKYNYQFPPLQTLSLRLGKGLGWLPLLEGCRNTLTSLRLHASYKFDPSFKRQIRLPHLKTLEVRNTTGGTWPLDLKTPLLETYSQYREIGSLETLHRDLTSIKELRINEVPTLSDFPLLQKLQLTNDVDTNSILYQFATIPGLCRHLKLIEQEGGMYAIDPIRMVVNIEELAALYITFSVVRRLSDLWGILSDSTEHPKVPCASLHHH